MRPEMIADTEYQEHVIEHVDLLRDGRSWLVTFDGGVGIQFVADGIDPCRGDTIRCYGLGFGAVVRGICINGVPVYYRTEVEEAAEERRRAERWKRLQRETFERTEREKLDYAYSGLPVAFQKRIDRFRANNPRFRWELEAYEMSVCVDAVKIAEALSTPEAVEAFRGLGWTEQQERVPGLFDGHSGNSFSCAVHLARLYLLDQWLVVLEHGALCPLLGCRDYGCAPCDTDAEEVPAR